MDHHLILSGIALYFLRVVEVFVLRVALFTSGMACPEIQQKVLRMELDRGGAFDFSNCVRNMALARMGVPPPKVRSTGTTIVAATYKVSFL